MGIGICVSVTAALSLFPAITAATAAACVLFFIPAAFSGTRIWTVVCKNGVKAGWKKAFKPLFVFAPSALLLISSRTIAFPLVFSQYAFGSACGSTRSA